MVLEIEKDKNEKPEAEEETASSGWVSDQVMWEAALGFRQDDKVQKIIEPNTGNEIQQFFERDFHSKNFYIPLAYAS